MGSIQKNSWHCRDSRSESHQEFCFPRRQSWRDSRQDRAEIFATVNLLLGENPARFWPPGLLLPGENRGEIRGRIAPRFWPPGFLLPARILARFAAGSRELRFLARILPGSRRDSRREEKSRRPKSRRDPDGIPAEIAAGSRQDPGSYFTREMASLAKFSTVFKP